METKLEKTKNIRRKTVTAVKCKDDTQEYLEAMDHFTDPELKILIFGRVAPKLEKPAMVQLAVRQYLITKESYFLDKAMEGVENIISNRRYETGVHEDICQSIKSLYAGGSVTDELAEWLTKLTKKILHHAVIYNMRVFFDTIMEIVRQYDVAIPSMYITLMRIYGSDDKEHLLIEFRRCRPEHEWQVPGCCLQGYFYTENEDADFDVGEYVWDDENSFDDEAESEVEGNPDDIDDIDDFDSEYDDEDDYDKYDSYEQCCCDPMTCKIYSKILYFTTAICLYKSWLDSSWKTCNGVDLGIETHRKYCGYIEQAYGMLEDTYCENPDIDMDLFHAQYQLFVSTFVNM